MDSKRGKSPSRTLSQNRSSSASKKKRPSSAKPKKPKESFTNLTVAQSFAAPKKTKKSGLVKKKLEEIKHPDLIIKANYKKKKISIPLTGLEEKGIHETMAPHIARFER